MSSTPVITLYQHADFRGRAVPLTESTPNFLALKFNDAASSAIVSGGTWVLYEHANYKGKSMELKPGKYGLDDIMRGIGNDKASSVKLLTAEEHADEQGKTSPPVESTPNPVKNDNTSFMSSTPLITLYQHSDFRGRAVPLTESTPNFLALKFNDATSSAIVSGGTWMLYEHADYKGKSMELKLGKYGLDDIMRGIGNDNASSVKLLTAEIILFEHDDKRGKALPLVESTPNLVKLGFNDKTSSITVVSGTWTIFQHADYRGKSKQLTKGYYDFGYISSSIGNDNLSSVKLDSY